MILTPFIIVAIGIGICKAIEPEVHKADEPKKTSKGTAARNIASAVTQSLIR